ncbi:X2-like carbohydrate binding domain-containing protein [Natranaerofaba carboxydovora]|uniref:X2-like carbohydrate binding domain-containing protein n=1 Tax=Natranaerofaba carboxydovora TaxID=2742683 RepID=UPI001F140585|nr:X2-like carbohydrate binding domain-containing protein [Natranaerofaba carboxydovora]UMZ74958.1 Carbohydrate binding domain X2 [Natranaerofaba carboxydovora]
MGTSCSRKGFWQRKFGFGFFAVGLMVILLAGAYSGISGNVATAQEGLDREATLLEFSGDVVFKRDGGEKEISAFEGMTFTKGDQIITGRDSWAEIEVDDTAEVRLSENSKVYINELIEYAEEEAEESSFSLFSGGFFGDVKDTLTTGSRFEVETDTAVMGVRGTDYYVSKDNDETSVSVISGSISVEPREEVAEDLDPAEDPADPETPEETLDPGEEFELEAGETASLEETPDGRVDTETTETTHEDLDLEALERLQEMGEEDPDRVPEELQEGLDDAIEERRQQREARQEEAEEAVEEEPQVEPSEEVADEEEEPEPEDDPDEDPEDDPDEDEDEEDTDPSPSPSPSPDPDPEPAYFAVEIIETEEVEANETMEIEVEVENEGEETDTQTIELLDFDGDVVDENEGLELEGGQDESFALEWNTEEDDVGTDDITVASNDEEATEEVTIEEVVPETLGEITEENVKYDLDAPADVEVSIEWNDATEVTEVELKGDVLSEGDQEDYVVDEQDDELTIHEDTITNGLEEDDELDVDVTFDVGEDSFVINVIDTEVVDATIDPTEADFDLNDPEDVETTITYNEASEVEEVTGEGIEDGDWDVDADTLSIKFGFLETFGQGEELEFNFEFDKGEDATLEIEVLYIVENYDISLTSLEGEGEVTVDGDTLDSETDSIEIEEGTEVTIEAVADDGYEFNKWSENASEKTEGSFDVTIEEDYDIGAEFAEVVPETYTVTFEEENDVNAEIIVYEDKDRTEQVGDPVTIDNGNVEKDLEDGDYWFTATEEDHEDYDGDFEVINQDKTVGFEMTPEADENIEVTETSPEDNATDVEVDTDLEVTFDESIELLDEDEITLEDEAEDAIDFNASETDEALTISPDDGLAYEEDYTVEVGIDAIGHADNNDIKLDEAEEFSFTTETKDEKVKLTINIEKFSNGESELVLDKIIVNDKAKNIDDESSKVSFPLPPNEYTVELKFEDEDKNSEFEIELEEDEDKEITLYREQKELEENENVTFSNMRIEKNEEMEITSDDKADSLKLVNMEIEGELVYNAKVSRNFDITNVSLYEGSKIIIYNLVEDIEGIFEMHNVEFKGDSKIIFKDINNDDIDINEEGEEITVEQEGDKLAQIDISEERNITEDDNEIEIDVVPGIENFEVEIDEGESTFEQEQGSDFDVQVDVENTGDAEGTQTIKAEIDGDEVASQKVEALDVDTTETINLNFEAEADHDDEDVKVESEDDSDTARLTVDVDGNINLDDEIEDDDMEFTFKTSDYTGLSEGFVVLEDHDGNDVEYTKVEEEEEIIVDLDDEVSNLSLEEDEDVTATLFKEKNGEELDSDSTEVDND